LHAAIAPRLEALIVTRATEKHLQPRNTGLTAVVVALLALGYLFMALYLSVTRSIARVRAAAEGMVRGSVRSVSLGTADEIGDIATSFNEIATALQAAEHVAERAAKAAAEAEQAARAAERAQQAADEEKARAVGALEQARLAELKASAEKVRVEQALRAADEHRRESQHAQSALAVENERKLEAARAQADAATTLRDKIDRILRVVDSASAGNFKDRVYVSGSEPIDAVAVQLNGLFERVDGTLTQVEQASENLSQTSDQFVSLNRTLTVSAKETATVADRALALATLAKDESNRLSTQANDIRTSSSNIHNRAEANARASIDVAERATATEAVARELAQASRDIAGFTRVITTISAQTRLLALNATIEASRAGESGRGFAVVASEVKDLAQQTEAAAEQVEAQTARIQKVVEQVEHAIAQIIERSVHIREQSQNVLTSVEAQGQSTSQMFELIAQSIHKLDEINENLATVKHVARSGTATAESIQSESVQMSRLSARLREVVAQFKSHESGLPRTAGSSSSSSSSSLLPQAASGLPRASF
jgi:methyl-accepting chemotaxis protein